MSFHLWSFGQHSKGGQDVMLWRLMAFGDLRVEELYEVMRLRTEVFVLEQQCLYQDMDGADPKAMHVLGVRHGEGPGAGCERHGRHHQAGRSH